MNQHPTLQRIIRLKQLFADGKIPTLSSHEVNPGLEKGSRENYLYFTLPPCLNFQRQSPAMWKSALATWEDPETQYLFYPERVVATPIEKVRADLRKHKLSLQPNKHTEIWTKICAVLHDQRRRRLFERLICVLKFEFLTPLPYVRSHSSLLRFDHVLHADQVPAPDARCAQNAACAHQPPEV